ncbi:MAG: 2'-5'-RNA ligase [Deltaproteobacteria bacterium ADurb.Bin510]|nr:MAG: 2'-5'-RNA ligase [Deltaproteobacteria bacterium ADurb.Bin510]
MPIRAFIAAELPPPVKDELMAAGRALERKGLHTRWLGPDNLHLTLKFLGNIDEALVPQLGAELDGLLAGVPPLSLSLDRLGAFPNRRAARVIWAGLAGETARLAELAAAIDRICALHGILPEKRPFRGHITLARLKNPSMLDLDTNLPTADFTLDKVNLYASTLSRDGASYRVLHGTALGSQGGI